MLPCFSVCCFLPSAYACGFCDLSRSVYRSEHVVYLLINISLIVCYGCREPCNVQAIPVQELHNEHALPLTPELRVNIVAQSIRLCTAFTKLYSSHTSAAALFDPLRQAVRSLELDDNCDLNTSAAEYLKASQEVFAGFVLEPLTLQRHKPVPIISIEPDFEVRVEYLMHAWLASLPI